MNHRALQNIFYPLERLLAILNSLLLALSFLGLFYPDAFLVDLFGNFLVQIVLMSFTGAILFFVRKNWPLFFVSFFLLIMKGYSLSPYILLTEAPKASDSFKVIVSNVNSANTHYEEVLNGVKSHAPEIAAFVEVNSEWDKNLKTLSTDFPFSESVVREDNFGLALYSKLPLTDIVSGPIKLGEPPIIKASIVRGGGKATFFLVHTVPPGGSEAFNLRNEELRELGKVIKETEGESILLGDLNTTPWSAHFKNLLNTAALNDPRKSFGILPTWTQDFPPFLIPIDHILSTKNLPLSNLTLHSTPGSDHRALVAEIR